MRLSKLHLPALFIVVVLLDAAMDAPRPAAADSPACSAGACLANSAVGNRVQPTSVTADDRGDVTFFASQSGQLPNIVFVLDNSTSMYELPYNVAAFPNSSWVTQGPTATTTATGSPAGATPNACGNYTSGTTCSSVAFSATVASCGGNSYLSGLRDASGNPYSKATTYPVPDSAFSTYFTSNNVYKFVEWNTGSPGGQANGNPITFTPSGTTGIKGTVSAASGACTKFPTSTAASGGSSTGGNAWTINQQQRCQMCLDEVGYYIAPGSSSTDQASGNILFKGNFLNFFPPKFMVARKVLTDFISRQSTTASPVRVGVVTYDNANASYTDVPAVTTGFTNRHDGGTFISAGMVPDCSVTNWTSSATQTQQSSLISAVRGISFGTLSSPVATPLAETVFNVGQFYGGSNTYYTNTFGSQWLKSGFTAPTGNNKPLCVSCQVNSIVLITDGEPLGDNNLPQQFRNNTIQCPHTSGSDPCGVDQQNGTPNLLDDVTNFLATTDLSPDATGLVGLQNVVTYVIGMGLKVPLLDNAAKYGKTTSAMRADNAQDLQDEIANAVVNIVARATAFSSTAIQTLQVGTGSTAFVPRFIPGSPRDPIWEGHLFRFDLFNEFVAGVDKNGDGNLNGVFLVDRDGDIVTEDDQGAFHKLIGGQPGAPAVPIWDAGAQLAATAASSRTIYTAIPATGGGWRTLTLPSWNGSGTPPADFVSVENALATDGTTACADIKAAMATPIPAAYLNSSGVFDKDHCAKAILDYVRGFNIMNELTTTTAVTANRARMLGDIFHSSPVVVDPPVDYFLCNLSLHNQCLYTLYGDDLSQPLPSRLVKPTPSDQYTVGTRTITAYEKYWEDHETRQRIVLVGANDGMIHALDAGTANLPLPANVPGTFRQVTFSSGTGNEVWAFIPPDQLPRLWLMMRDGHQMYMDGDIMVRDVWVDGAPNDKGTAAYVNDVLVKQDVEFHTVAVAAERQGGSHFVALDVTDTTVPKMLWIYPPPCSNEEALWGQTWGQFSPKAPPIGPVLLETSNTAGLPNRGVAHTEERWAVFLNGGHSPYMTRGRIVSLLDVWTGTPLFSARYNPAATDPNDPAKAMRFGFAATPALADYSTDLINDPLDGIFDTGVIGDEGGQVWTFRFSKPGHINSSTNLVDNWSFGRAYEPNKGSPDDPRYHQPIFTLASMVAQYESANSLRAYIGTGDRAHVRSQSGGDCRPDDPMSCISAGCTVNSSLTLDNATTHYVSAFGSAVGSSSGTPAISSPTSAITTVSANACNTSSVSQSVTVSACPTTAMNFSDTSLTFSCLGSPLACTDGAFPQPTPNTNRNVTNAPPNTFFSVAVISPDLTPVRLMDVPTPCTPASACHDAFAYDQGRLTATDLTDVSNVRFSIVNGAPTLTSTGTAATPASPFGAGWIVKFTTPDEKNVTSTTILNGCALFNTLIPNGGTVGCASAGANTARTYEADVFTGAPNCGAQFLQADNSYAQYLSHAVLSPPPEPAAAVSIGSGGSSVRLSMLEIQPGKNEVTQTTVSTNNEMLKVIYSMPLTVDQHICRHVDPLKCQ
jgi:type IV pilus assembly protein PilY1